MPFQTYSSRKLEGLKFRRLSSMLVIGLMTAGVEAAASSRSNNAAPCGGKADCFDTSFTVPLEQEITRIAAASEGTVGVAAIHLPSGRRVQLNGSKPFEMASTLKLPLAIYAMHLGDRGKIPLTTPLPVQRSQLIEPGILHDHFPFSGLALSTLNAIELSVTVSDNGATDIIYSRVGGPQTVNSWLHSAGLSGINMGRQTVSETFAQETAITSPANSPDLSRTATPNAMAEMLAQLYSGRLLSKESTSTILDVMKRTKGERISLQLPPGAIVRHKTGTLFGAKGLSVNDVGLVELPNGGAIALAVFIKDSPESVSHSTRDKVIGGISRAIYDSFLLAPNRPKHRRARLR